jgi:hypothetical protein
MIVVTMQLHSAITGRQSTLAIVKIANDGTGTPTRGNYSWAVYGKRKLLRCGTLVDWPRKSKTAPALLARVLAIAYPSSRPRSRSPAHDLHSP